MKSIEQRIAEELGVRASQVQAAIELLDGGSTVPFIARYRKEATGALDDAQLRIPCVRMGSPYLAGDCNFYWLPLLS